MFIAFIIFAVLAGISLVGFVATALVIGDKDPSHDLYPICVMGFIIFGLIALFLGLTNYGIITFNPTT